jgi:hypothetical protein
MFKFKKVKSNNRKRTPGRQRPNTDRSAYALKKLNAQKKNLEILESKPPVVQLNKMELATHIKFRIEYWQEVYDSIKAYQKAKK